MNFADQLQRFGLLLPQGRPTVVLAGTAGEIGRLYPTVDAALRLRPEHRLVLAAPSGEVGGLRRRFPHEVVLPLPHSAAGRYWLLRLQAVLVIDPAGSVGPGAQGFPGASPPATPEALATMLPPFDSPKRQAPARAFLVDLLGGRRTASLTGLKARLRDPRTIICLGNGPSSEDPGLADHRDAVLFRVNWNWRGRGWLDKPDVVFTADPDLPPFGQRPVIVFPTAAAGRPILTRHAMAMRPPSSGYVFLDEFDPALADLSGPMIPTNGALMIAVAAALKPDRIVIAGMDLYRHPEGRYPGDASAQDGYSREHSAEIDLGLIRAALDGFAGETVILSDNLRAALAAR
ncbi:hypothetical protein [Mesorhizobium sp.]|uniref:hypothetical protein n=1 Tax=Mesorhizobium sp. TaxID=1871066 RepID=UPI0025D96BF0|nr:hypothetical protein [Mesorhizobium sp.]